MQLSCYCDACLDDHYDEFENKAYVDKWEGQDLEREHGHQPTMVTRRDVSMVQEAIKHLATKDAVVAIAEERIITYFR